jgi:hypothetical protein
VPRPAIAVSLLLLVAAAAPAAGQSIRCPEGTKPGARETGAGKLQWCERPGADGPIWHGPLLGFYPSGRPSFEFIFVEGTPRGPIQAWYENGQPSATGETGPDNGTLTLRDERGRKRAQIDVRNRQVVTQAWDEQGREEPYDEAKLVRALPANRDLAFIMNLFAVGIGIQ